jgi:hypothetical protein
MSSDWVSIFGLSSYPVWSWKYTCHTNGVTVTSPINSRQANGPPCITAGISFSRNPCPRSVQRYQMNFTHRCIGWFRNSQLLTGVPCSNWRGLGTCTVWTRARIWSQCTHWQDIYQTPEWAVIQPSSISQPYFYWASGTELQGRIDQCQPGDHGWGSWHLGQVYEKSTEWPRQYRPRMNSFLSSITLQLDSTEWDPPISGVPGSWQSNIDVFQDGQNDLRMGSTSSSSRICSGDFNKAQRDSSLGWVCRQVHPGGQTDE